MNDLSYIWQEVGQIENLTLTREFWVGFHSQRLSHMWELIERNHLPWKILVDEVCWHSDCLPDRNLILLQPMIAYVNLLELKWNSSRQLALNIGRI